MKLTRRKCALLHFHRSHTSSRFPSDAQARRKEAWARTEKLREAFLWSVASGEACIASSHPAAPTAYVRLSPQCTASLLPTQCCCCSFHASLISPILFTSPPTHREIASSQAEGRMPAPQAATMPAATTADASSEPSSLLSIVDRTAYDRLIKS